MYSLKVCVISVEILGKSTNLKCPETTNETEKAKILTKRRKLPKFSSLGMYRVLNTNR